MIHDYPTIAKAVLADITNDDFQLRGDPTGLLVESLKSHFEREPTKPMEVKHCCAVGNLQEHMGFYKHSLMDSNRFAYQYREPSRTAIAEHALKRLDGCLEEDRVIHERNIDAMAHNAKIRETIESTMKSVGIPASYSERDSSSRKQIKPWITKSAGYVGDITRNLRTGDGWDAALAKHKRLLEKFTQELAEARKLDELDRTKAEREQAEALKKREEDMKLATMLVHYSLPPLSTWPDVLTAICDRSARLNLACAMYQTRRNWNDGPRSVRHALYDPGDNETDKLIVADIEECLDNWDGDGRIFRDTTWDYGSIFASIEDAQLVADAHEALEHVDP